MGVFRKYVSDGCAKHTGPENCDRACHQLAFPSIRRTIPHGARRLHDAYNWSARYPGHSLYFARFKRYLTLREICRLNGLSEIVEKLKQVSVRRLNLMLQAVLSDSDEKIANIIALSRGRDDVLFAFVQNMNNCFDELLGKPVEKPEAVFNYETLSLMKDDDLEILVALEGMVNYARNTQLPNFISFNTRLNSLFEKQRVDESSNPLDPSQIATAFKDAVQPLGLSSKDSLTLYRQFNAGVLRKLEEVLVEANHLLIEHGVIPNLGMDGGRKKRPAARVMPRPPEPTAGFGTVEEEPFDAGDENPELFSMMQGLLHPGAAAAKPSGPAPPAGPGTKPDSAQQQYSVPSGLVSASQQNTGIMQAFTPAPGEQVQLVDQAQLMSILSNIQKSLDERNLADRDKDAKLDPAELQNLDIKSTLGELLKEGQDQGVVNAVDRQSSDIINLVTLLYEAIWDDDSVPIPIKELIGRTQITIIKVALSDTTFFNKENHPARMVLNEFAAAGIGWMEVDELQGDPLYQKVQQLVGRILAEYDGGVELFEEIIKDFRTFRAREAAKTRVLEQRILRAKERQERLSDINELVTQKITERVLGRDLNEFVQILLNGPFHKFMVMLVLKEGPGTNAWKQAVNTIDVLLWTVQNHDQPGDRKRLDTVNPRLLNNLRKAFRIAQLEAGDVDRLITRLKTVQEATFVKDTKAPAPKAPARAEFNVSPEPGEQPKPVDTSIQFERNDATPSQDVEDELPEGDLHVSQVDQLHVGVWVEFSGDDGMMIRCKLAARISAIDKYIFVNRQGVKVIEKTRMGLAQELKDGTVKVISDGLLFSRALESVIGNLRDAQQREQTSSAYQPAT